MDHPPEAWYRDGLKFECTRCGACCTGAPGYVWVSSEEIDRLAAAVNLGRESFGRRYLRNVDGDISLIERPNGDCVFWDRAKGCTVYEARPEQCRTWPFWPSNVETAEDWGRVQAGCPGAGRGQLFTVEEIVATLKRADS